MKPPALPVVLHFEAGSFGLIVDDDAPPETPWTASLLAPALGIAASPPASRWPSARGAV